MNNTHSTTSTTRQPMKFAFWRSFCVWMALLTCSFAGKASGQGFQGQQPSLRTLPPMRALPMNADASTSAPAALKAPHYCDSGTLRQSATIRAIRFRDNRHGVAVGDHGCILYSEDGGQTWNESASGVDCQLNDALWTGSNHVLAVGGGHDPVTRISRGVALVSRDAGKSWQRAADSDLPRFRSVEQLGPVDRATAVANGNSSPLIYASTDPDPVSGASVFESRDGGRSWQSSTDEPASITSTGKASSPSVTTELAGQWANATNCNAVIRTSCRVDEQTVICAGDHGVILRSTTNGKAWQKVHSNDASCAVLIISGDAGRIPWSLIGRESLEKRLRTNLIVGTRSKLPAITLGQATMNLGAASLDGYESSSADSGSAVSGSAVSGSAVSGSAVSGSSDSDSLGALRTWITVHQSPILVLDAELPAKTKTALLQHAVSNAAEKVVEYSLVDRGEALLLHTAVLTGCGVLAGDFANDSHLLVASRQLPIRSESTSAWVSINTRYSGGSQLIRGDSLGTGMQLSSRHRLPSRQSTASRRRLQVIQGRIRHQAAVDDLFRINGNSPTSPRVQSASGQRFVEAMGSLLDQTSRIDQFRSAWSIAGQSVGTANQTLVWDEIANRFGNVSGAQLAKLHSQARASSLEWKLHRSGHGGLRTGRQSTATADSDAEAAAVQHASAYAVNDDTDLLPTGAGHAAILSPFQTNTPSPASQRSPIMQTSATLPTGFGYDNRGHSGYPSANPTPTQTRTQGEVDLAWQMHPVRLIVEDAIERQSVATAADIAEQLDAASVQHALSPDSLSADLRRVAQRKSEWANLLKTESPQSTTAVRTGDRPLLDGKLNEPFWRTDVCKPATTQGTTPTQLQLAWDDQFIYIAIRVPRGALNLIDDHTSAGRRDADLTQSDRLSIALDVDRDLLTSMNISFTRDGRTHDDLDGNSRWNPTWYVASSESSNQVTTEIAIEQSSLGVTPQPSDSWFIKAESIRSGFRSCYELMPSASSRIRVDFR